MFEIWRCSVVVVRRKDTEANARSMCSGSKSLGAHAGYDVGHERCVIAKRMGNIARLKQTFNPKSKPILIVTQT